MAIENIIDVTFISRDLTILYRHPELPFSGVYQNTDTRAVDRTFGLKSKPLGRDEKRELELATGFAQLGEWSVEKALQYFSGIASIVGCFVGLKEEEVRDQFREMRVDTYCITAALEYKDWVRHDLPVYLKRIEYEGENILFPCNLERSSWITIQEGLDELQESGKL